MLDGLARYIEGNERDNLNGLMRADAKRAIGIGVSGGVTMHRLHHSNHQNQRDADHPDQSNPGGASAQL